ncbi:amidase [bacterium 336/3]|nr:amidase [bacterium 336/3]
MWQCSPSNSNKTAGNPIDSLNGVVVYYNGAIDNTFGRNLTPDGYNLGLKYQCVEFVKRYYYEHLKHKMPDSYGHAKDFFNKKLKDGTFNKQRNLIQYTNPSKIKPKVNDLVVFAPTTFNQYGHVAIVSNVKNDELEIIQQNAGTWGNSREAFKLSQDQRKWQIHHKNLLGWLRKE